LPRHPISESLARILWWWARQLGATLPSYKSVRKEMNQVQQSSGMLKTHQRMTASGDVVFVNDVNNIIQLELANPRVMQHLRTIPEDTADAVAELYQSNRWNNDAAFATPMIRHNRQDFYVGELAVCISLQQEGDEYWLSATSHEYSIECLEVCTPAPTSVIRGRYVEGENGAGNVTRVSYRTEQASAFSERAQHLRTKAQGKRVVMIPLILFCDDVSGNVSKKWNAHYNWYMQLAGLPFEQTQLDYNVHFIATSNTLSPLQIGREVLQDIVDGIEKGIDAYDARRQEHVLAIGGVFLVECDNPMANELAATIDLRRGGRFCRFCNVQRGTDVESLQALTQITHLARQWNVSRDKLIDRLSLASKPETTKRALDIAKKSTGIDCKYASYFIDRMRQFVAQHPGCTQEDVLQDMQQRFGPVRDQISPMFKLGYNFDAHKHIPVEILHTVSLGLVEYLMNASIDELTDEEKNRLVTRINSLSAVGFQRPFRGQQLVQYCKSLQGKDRRAFVQVAVFAFQGLLAQKWLIAWQYLATVAALLFTRRIEHLDIYLDTLQRALNAMIASICDVDVQWLSSHAKFHILLHVEENIRQFGPAVLYMSEKFESFNKVMRNHAVHTNRHGPSVDIARRFARHNTVRHLFSGGMFL
ncbi:hypothetical protein BC832DRAFT_520421, partial [Gaertneriomyces semiglobifer]